MDDATVKKRTRLSPEKRRAQILDDATRIVLTEGLSAVNMERLGREAGISKALVYNYFPSRDALLAALLHREQTELRERGMQTALKASTYAELIRHTTRLYLEQTRERGALIAALLSDPSVAQLMEEENRAERDRTFRYFVKATRKEFNLPLPLGIAAVDMLMAVTDQGGKLMVQGVLDIDAAEDMCLQLILGGLTRLAAKYGETA
jgi:AcrR family transcriptional regulator